MMSGLRARGWLRDHHADVSLFLHGVALQWEREENGRN